MYCSKCGSEIKDGANFCFKCGNKSTKQNIVNPKKISTIPVANTSKKINASNEMTTSMASIKNQPNTKRFIIIAVVIGVLSIGFISYYISLSKFSSTTTRASDTTSIKNEVIPSNTVTNKTPKAKSKATTSANKTDSTDSYVFSKSSSEDLLDSDVSTLVKGDLSLARNEIFARHGFIFKSEPFKSYFNNKSWYKQNPLFKGTDPELNAKELYNIQLILKYENK
ncbi:YARHG domain-containing protein [Clostridium estertheticum]|uniref:YARHG domain-containing protein n=1 Tax=Clostridium estertheticum TaxID=238834 RepID=UPI001C0B1CB8|nr:YARHG domain-containing protein [Clostridium estertheticum]MBU3200404.1 YARHG domain-containing protein [Clostridium estertheticum]WAG67235.1 YARHG domain-containing protein [Clostridium estertheticum]